MDLEAITTQWASFQSMLNNLPIEPRYAIPLAFLVLIVVIGITYRILLVRRDTGGTVYRYVPRTEEKYEKTRFVYNVNRGIALKYEIDENNKTKRKGAGYYFDKINMEYLDINKLEEYLVDVVCGVDNYYFNDIVYANTDLFKTLVEFCDSRNKVGENLYAKFIVCDSDEAEQIYDVIICRRDSKDVHPDSPNKSFVSSLGISENLFNRIYKYYKEVDLYSIKGEKGFFISNGKIIKARFEQVNEKSVFSNWQIGQYKS